ncbi:MAG: recombinase family protein [Flavobacteriaceae bacterium]|nr:MAG: recombinase family protein [Flavobacteriaceae bacterium]
MTKYVVYYRITIIDHDHGVDFQSRMLDKYSIVDDYLNMSDEIIREFTEIEAGTRMKFRPVLQEAIAECKKTGATLLIAKLDRLTSNIHFISSLEKAGIKFKAIGLTEEVDKPTIQILSALAQREAKLISQRTKEALAKIRNKIDQDGYYITRNGNKISSLGNPQNLTNESRRKALDVIKERKKLRNLHAMEVIKERAEVYRLKGERPNLSEIARLLNDRGIKTSRGKQFHPVQVKRLIEAL